MNSWKNIGLVVAVMMLTSCYNYDEDQIKSGDPVTVELAYTFSSSAGSVTRQPSDVVVPNSLVAAEARMPNDLRIIPMIGKAPQPSNVLWESPVPKNGAGDMPSSLLYHSSYCSMVIGVDGCLVYGSVADVLSGKENNGSLVYSPFATIGSQSDLERFTFSLESIYPETEAPADASTLAGYLNTIANVEGWQASSLTNPILKNLFENYTGHGSALPGSAASVKQWVAAIKDAAQGYYDNPPSSIGEDEKTILHNIVSAADGISITVDENSYPRDIHLPDGAAAVRWNGSAFVPAMQTTTLDNINSVSRFAYPASLFYFVDSDIKAAEEKVDFATVYGGVTTSTTQTAWSQVLADAKFKKDEVTSDTKSVALESPVQYAVAQLHVYIQASADALPDADTKDANDPTQLVTIGDDFRLTGVIVCGQRPVNYLFVPGSNSDVDVKFIYDSQVNSNSVLSKTQEEACSTLVLQSYEGDDVDIILEFQNNGTQSFRCIDGFVYPGTRFYLIGKVEANSGTGGNDESRGRVFTKDYITTVNMTVTSLANAYNVLPNLLTSNLEIGVETTPKWVAVTPTTIEFE